MTKEDKKYEVGYGKPPKSGQFKEGQSGNSKGRPKGRKSMRTIVNEVMSCKVALKKNGRTCSVSYMEAFVQQLAAKGLTGTTRDQIALLKAMNDYAPELLRELEPIRDITVQYVLPEGKTMEDYDSSDDVVDASDDDEDDDWLK